MPLFLTWLKLTSFGRQSFEFIIALDFLFLTQLGALFSVPTATGVVLWSNMVIHLRAFPYLLGRPEFTVTPTASLVFDTRLAA